MQSRSDWITKWPEWKNWLASRSWCVRNERPQSLWHRSIKIPLKFARDPLIHCSDSCFMGADTGTEVRVLHRADVIGSRKQSSGEMRSDYRCQGKRMECGSYLLRSLVTAENEFLKGPRIVLCNRQAPRFESRQAPLTNISTVQLIKYNRAAALNV